MDSDTLGNVQILIDEYRLLLGKSNVETSKLPSLEDNDIQSVLVNDCEWTPKAAKALLTLSKEYGAFMLRNALALSIALEIEDGDLNF